MAKAKNFFVCSQCGQQHTQWSGYCSACAAWNSLVEEVASPAISSRRGGYAGEKAFSPITLSDVSLQHETRFSTTIDEFDRALGGGLVAGSIILIGGDPGIGKSTLLLQTLCHLSLNLNVLYVTGEESLQQVALRAHRLQLPQEKLMLLPETQIQKIIQAAQATKAQILAIDSIQTMYTDELNSAAGSVAQVRETTAHLVRFAKQTGTTVFIIGHVTKEGSIAGPRVLEHMVDTVLYFESMQDNRFRIVRAIKNRFGAVNELGLFAMTDRGLKALSNPSAIFLSGNQQPNPGSVITVTWEGTRPLLVEIQALLDESHLANPRRVAVGIDPNRLAMLLAILNRHRQCTTYNQDVFINVVGGVKILETAADLALLVAVQSSLRNRVIPSDTIIFGEVGLAGEIRPVQSGLVRLREAAKHGFKRAIIPKANKPKQPVDGLEIVALERLTDLEY